MRVTAKGTETAKKGKAWRWRMETGHLRFHLFNPVLSSWYGQSAAETRLHS